VTLAPNVSPDLLRVNAEQVTEEIGAFIEATIGRLEEVAAEAAGKGAQLVLFPETFLPAYPTNRWVRYLAGGDGAVGAFRIDEHGRNAASIDRHRLAVFGHERRAA